MERNGNNTTGGSDGNFEEMMLEGGIIDEPNELTPPSLSAPGSCLECPMFRRKAKEWAKLVGEFEDVKRIYPRIETGP